MKELLYGLFAFFFRLGRLLPVKNNKVCFVSMHNEGFHDSLGAVMEELDKRGGYTLCFINKNDLSLKTPWKAARFFLADSVRLATSAFVFLNDNFLPLSKVRFSAKTTVVQLWHAEGAFKRFGLSIEQPENVRKSEIEANKRLDYVVCSSKAVAPIYAEAFGVDEKKVLALGSARTDLLYRQADTQRLREEFLLQHPDCRGKKLVLYAPTFRDEPAMDRQIMQHFDAQRLERELGGDCAVFIRLHPQIHGADMSKIKQGRDLTSYPDATKLIRIFDVLITDYSSICMDFVLLDKPCIFYAFDLDAYNAARSFYFAYEAYVPGKVAHNMAELTEALQGSTDGCKAERFKRFNFDSFDGQAAKRIVDTLLSASTA